MAGIAIWIAIGALGVLIAHRKEQEGDRRGQPKRGSVKVGTAIAAIGAAMAVVAIPRDLTATATAAHLAAVVVIGMLLVRAAATQSVGWTTWGETATSTAWLGLRTPRRLLVTAAAIALGTWSAVWLGSQDVAGSTVMGAAIGLAPARWHLRAGWRRETTRTAVEKAVAGAFSGGQEWDRLTAADRGAPIKVGFDGDVKPDRVSSALPPEWRATSLEADREEVRQRLAKWGVPWTVAMSSSERTLSASLCAPLPTCWTLPNDRSWEWIEANKPSPLALYLGEAQDADTGESFPLWWDPDVTDPHALVGGKTKSGKTVGLQLLVAQAIARGWDAIIADPKGVDFAWAGRLPRVRYFPGPDCLNGVAEAVGEMHERQGWLHRNLWSGVDGADEIGDLLKTPNCPYRPCLVIVDEAAEAAGLGDKEEQRQTSDGLSSLARLSRFAGMVCAFATQRPDVKFLSGETKANLGTRVLYGSAGPILTRMVLDMPSTDMAALSQSVRGRGRAVITEGIALEFQGGFVTPRSIKDLRGVLGPDELAPIRFTDEPQWRTWVREGLNTVPVDRDAAMHPDYKRVAHELDERMEAREQAAKTQSGHPVPDADHAPTKPEHPGPKSKGSDGGSAGVPPADDDDWLGDF